MLLCPDGSTLYVAVRRGRASVAAVDTDTLEVSTVTLIAEEGREDELEPLLLTWAADMLWVVASYDGHQTVMVAVDPDKGTTHYFPIPYTQVSIASSLARPGTIVMVFRVGDLATVDSYSVGHDLSAVAV
jgi:hypothetical protein